MQKCGCGGVSDNEFKKPTIPVPANQTRMISSSPITMNKDNKTSERIIPFSDEIIQLFILGGIATVIILIVIKKC